MKMTLRQAHRLQQKIQNAIKETNISTRRPISIYLATDSADWLHEAADRLDLDFSNTILLNELLYTIRELVWAANSESQISTLIHERRKLIAELALYTRLRCSIPESFQETSSHALKEELAAEKANHHSYDSNTLMVTVVTNSFVEHHTAKIFELENELESIDDQIAELNNSILINIDFEQELRQHRLI